MSNKKAEVRKYIEQSITSAALKEVKGFGPFDEATCFKFNTPKLVDTQIIGLSNLMADMSCDVIIRRSGTGLVVLIRY